MIIEIVGSVRVFPHGWNQQTCKLLFLPLHCYHHICATACSNLRAESPFTCMFWQWSTLAVTPQIFWAAVVTCCISVNSSSVIVWKRKKLFTFLFKVDFYWFMSCYDIQVDSAFCCPESIQSLDCLPLGFFVHFGLLIQVFKYMQFRHIAALYFFWIGEAILCFVQSCCE